MKTTKISNDFHVTGQVELANIPEITAAGFTTVICNRPDNEGWGQTNHDVVKAAAEKVGLSFHYIPVGGGLTHDMVHQMKAAITSSKGMVLGYCKSGMRAANLYQAALQH
jgi:uncharacterized protein (TIGR01244 family)